MSTARRGRCLEHELRDMMREAGWECIRGAGSKGNVMMPDGLVKCDLVFSKKTALDKRTVYLVLAQCKRVRR